MAKHRLRHLIAVSLVLAFLCFTASQSVEIAHPIEEASQTDHRHPRGDSGLDLVCVQSGDHNHFCLHQQSLAPSVEAPELLPTWARLDAHPDSDPHFLIGTELDLRPRGPPRPPSTV
ncbi:MAG TPA: hypothetical protein VLU25_18510 [Acidobacteriota bacterium]|nr:hypothetical protein [Acidobacteriota bacterium]